MVQPKHPAAFHLVLSHRDLNKLAAGKGDGKEEGALTQGLLHQLVRSACAGLDTADVGLGYLHSTLPTSSLGLNPQGYCQVRAKC